ncbi:MAG: hypothetical protein Q9204_001878 [Flavoplaca sp. TL-2023a]
MHIPFASLTSIFLRFDFSSSVNHPQIPLTDGPNIEASYGYVGPGVYRIVSYVNKFAVSLNTSQSTTGLVAMPPVDNDNAQRWLIADVSATEKMLINNGTGANLCAIKGSTTTRATLTPPYDLTARWTIDFDKYSDFAGSPVMLTNVGRENTVLDLRGNQNKAGTHIITYPVNKPRSNNQAWLLEYLESPPPAPDLCNFPEADQQALRGDVVPQCNKFNVSHTYTYSAEHCYESMKEDEEKYNIQSYVWSSSSNPGSPDWDWSYGECTGYTARSYRFFVGNSTGSSFGGDLKLPFTAPPPAPPPNPCERPEADQQALRGDVVPQCNKFNVSLTYTFSASRCYLEMKKYNLQSYVWSSPSNPGSPDPGREFGVCTGYTARSYRFFAGSPTGSSFGGDLALPFEVPPGPCNRPEADQQALRGNLLEQCYGGAKILLHSNGARECYDMTQGEIDRWKVQSYVFTSYSEPGSPNGEGDCKG